MTSNYDVTNNAHQIQITPYVRHWMKNPPHENFLRTPLFITAYYECKIYEVRSFQPLKLKRKILSKVEENGDVGGAKLAAKTFNLKRHLKKHRVDIFKRVVEKNEAKTSQTTASNAVCKKETLSKFFHYEKVTMSKKILKASDSVRKRYSSYSAIFTVIYEVTWRNGWQTGCVIRTRKHEEEDFMWSGFAERQVKKTR